MGLYLLYALTRIAGGAAQIHQDNEKWKNKHLVLCTQCNSENPVGSKYCSSCRSNKLLARKDALKEIQKQKAADLEKKAREVNHHRRKKQAQDYLLKYSEYKYCIKCNDIQQQERTFCNICGGECGDVPSYILLEWMKLEFPDVVRQASEMNDLKKYQYPHEITFGKIAVSTAETAGKITYKTVKAGGKSIFKEIKRRYLS